MSHPVDYERVEHIVADSSSQMKRLLQEAYRVGFLDGAEYQRRELVNMYQRSVADYTNQIEQHQDQLAKALDGAPGAPVSGPTEIQPVPDPVVRVQAGRG